MRWLLVCIYIVSNLRIRCCEPSISSFALYGNTADAEGANARDSTVCRSMSTRRISGRDCLQVGIGEAS